MSASDKGFEDIIERERGLRRSLSARQLSMIAIGGAIGTGLFLGSAFAIGFAGPERADQLCDRRNRQPAAHGLPGGDDGQSSHFGLPSARTPSTTSARSPASSCAMLLVVNRAGGRHGSHAPFAVYMQYWFPLVPGWVWIIGFSGLLIAINAREREHLRFRRVRILDVQDHRHRGLPAARHLLRAECAAGHPALAFQTTLRTAASCRGAVWGMWVAVIVAVFSYLSIEMIAVAAGEAKVHSAQSRAPSARRCFGCCSSTC